jgi:hypothetical protein
MNNEEIIFDDDKVYRYIPYADDTCETELVMTKEIFIECYKKWIRNVESEVKE